MRRGRLIPTLYSATPFGQVQARPDLSVSLIARRHGGP